MSALTNQVLLRNIELFNEGKWLLSNPPQGDIFSQLNCNSIFGFHQYYDVYQQACGSHSSAHHQFAAVYSDQKDFDGVVLFMPKAKAQAKMLIANLAPLIKPGGKFLLVGENKAGIKSAAKLLEPYSSQVIKIDSARHCSLFCAHVNDDIDNFKLEQWITELTVNVKDTELTIISLPGVFSHGELDGGTRLLLENMPQIPNGRILDFACGAGVIGCFVATNKPDTEVMMSDVSALALYCAEKTALANNINCSIVPSNGLENVQGSFNAVYTNPPFHTGIQTDYSVTERFISQLKQHLKPRAQLLLVANRFLKYPDAIESTFGNIYVVAKTSKFSLYQASSNSKK
jgi:16S rRNA (guanine1207-N2)-methyltransferase